MRSHRRDEAGEHGAEEPALGRSAALRIHIQGTFLLIVLLLVFWPVLNWAGSVIDSAMGGPDGAVVARALVESESPEAGIGGESFESDEPLDGDEVAELQSALLRFSFDPGPVDGILGDLTRRAADEAKADLGLAAGSDRRLLDTLVAAVDALDSASDDPGS